MCNAGRRRSIVAADNRLPSIGGYTTSALRSPFGPRRSTDDFRPLQAHFRKRSSAEQSLTSFRINSNDDDLVEEEEEEADFEERQIDEEESKTNSEDRGEEAGVTVTVAEEVEDVASPAATTAAPATAPDTEKKRASMKRDHTDDSEVEHLICRL